MNVTDVLFYVFMAASILYVVHIGLYLISANLYDIWQYRRRANLNALSPSFSLKSSIRGDRQGSLRGESDTTNMTWPLVTIAVPAHNEQLVIVRCLESIRNSTYPNIQILVSDDASSDGTKQLVRDYALRHPDMDIRVFRMHKHAGKGGGLSKIIRRYGKGEFVMMCDADSVISQAAVANALTYFENPTVAGVAANVQLMHEASMLGVLQKFEHMIGYRSKKMYTIMNGEFVVGGVASTYRMDVLRQVDFYDTDTMTEDIGLSLKITSLGNRAHRMVYAADVVAMTESVPKFRALVRQRFRWKYGSMQNLVKYRHLIGSLDRRYTRSLTLYRLPLAVFSEFVLLTAPLVWGYVIYMALTQYSPALVLGAYITLSAYMFIIIWFDENLRRPMRLRLTLYVPIAYFVFFVMELVQLIAVIHCLAKAPALLRQKDEGSAWKPPERRGKELAAHET